MEKKYAIVVLLLLVASIVGGYCYYFYKWKHLWTLENPKQSYHVLHNQDDTLRVVMIGDSWAGMHIVFDNYMIAELERCSGHSVIFESKGKGGEKTKGIYRLMFEEGYYGTKSLLTSCPDYCIVSAGINDAAANLGIKQYCHYYRQIIDFLLDNHIRPVIIEAPNVDLWLMLGEKPFFDLASDYLKSLMTDSGMYNYQEYREALLTMLENEGLIGCVLYIPMREWNGKDEVINENLFLDDHIHLNKKGYELLDSCIAIHIANDYRLR